MRCRTFATGVSLVLGLSHLFLSLPRNLGQNKKRRDPYLRGMPYYPAITGQKMLAKNSEDRCLRSSPIIQLRHGHDIASPSTEYFLVKAGSLGNVAMGSLDWDTVCLFQIFSFVSKNQSHFFLLGKQRS